jgi:N-acetylglucosamine-6-phosphate deacetylase
VISGIKLLRANGITVSIGHSRPTDAQWSAVQKAGATIVTHLFNGMSGVHHRDEGLALDALIDDGVYAGLIADMVHVSPKAVALAFKAKGGDRLCLVSDSVAWSSQWATKRSIAIKDGAPRLPDGTLAGSSTPLAECVRLAVTEAGVPVEEALHAATSSPSHAVGLADVGYIREGEPADLVAFDDSLHVVGAWRRLVSLRG